MRINTNLSALATHRKYSNNNSAIAKSVEKLSSGYQINSAADNAAGLAISEKMRAQIRGLQQASINSQDGISLVQTAEGGMGQATEVLQRMRELAVQSANDTNENEIDREALQDEFAQLQLELDHISKSTTFNRKNLLDGSLSEMHMATSDINLANSGISINLGNVAAGSYAFEAIVKPEKAAVTGVEAEFTPVTTSDAITILPGATIFEAGTPVTDAPVTVSGTAAAISANWNDTAADTASAAFTGNLPSTLTVDVNGTTFDVNFVNPASADAAPNTEVVVADPMSVQEAFDAAVAAINAQIAAANETGAAGNATYTEISELTFPATGAGTTIADLFTNANPAITTTTTEMTATGAAPSVTNNLGTTALPNGNYTMEATYNSATYELSIAAVGDNGQTFTAVLDRDALDTGSPFTLEFKNGSTTAFSFKIESTTKFTTQNASSVEAFARTVSESLSMSATNGVDAKEAEYALYATMTGAVDVKLEAGMEEVTFSNGITVNFDKLTVSDVTVNAGDYAEQTKEETPATYTNGSQITYANVTGAAAAGGGTTPADDTYTVTYDATAKTITATGPNGGTFTSDPLADDDIAAIVDGTGITGLVLNDNNNNTITFDLGNTVTNHANDTEQAGTNLTIDQMDFGTITIDATNGSSGTATAVEPVEVAAATEFTAGTAEDADITWAGTIATDNTIDWATSTSDISTTIDNTDFSVTIDNQTFTVALVENGGTTDAALIESGEQIELDATPTAQATLTAAIEALNKQIAAYNAEKAAGTETYNEIAALDAATIIAGLADTDVLSTDTEVSAIKGSITPMTAPEEEAVPTPSATFHRVFCNEDDTVSKSTFKVRGTEGEGLIFQIGANKGDELQIFVDELNCNYLGVASASILTRTQASEALGSVDKALTQVASQRAYLGAMQNRLEYKIDNLDTSAENLSAAEAQIRDVDMAKEMTKFTNSNILAQAATAMLAQANSLPQNVLSLLQG